MKTLSHLFTQDIDKAKRLPQRKWQPFLMNAIDEMKKM